MANYSLILDTKFKPFSYQEMLAPVAAATQAHQALEEEYGDLSAKASVWEEMANEQSDPYAYRMYKKYANDLEAQAGELARVGLAPTSRKGMLDMRTRYSKEIVPIENAYKRREELAAEQRKAIAANPTLRYQRMARAMSLDDFIKDPSLDYGESYSGALLTKQVSDAAANFQRALTDKGNLEALGLPYQYERMLQYGATPAQVMAAMSQDAQQGDSEAVEFLRGITDQVLKSSGVADWADPATMEEFRAFANQGLYSAIGQVKIDNFTDTYSMNDQLEKNKEARAEARRQRELAEAQRQQQIKMYRTNSASLYSSDEVTKQNKILMEDIDKWKSKGYLTAKGELTYNGLEALKNAIEYNSRDAAGTIPDSPYWKGQMGKGRDFLKWASSHGVTYNPGKMDNWDAQGRIFVTYNPTVDFTKLNSYTNDMITRAASGELANGVANVQVGRVRVGSKTASDNLVDLMTSTNSNIFEVGSLNSSGKLNSGEAMSPTQFAALVKGNSQGQGGSRIVHIINNPAGNQQIVELANGRRFFIPSTVFGESVVNPRTGQGDLDRANAILRAESSANPGEASDAAIVAFANSQAYLSSLLDYSNGTNIDYMGSVITEDLQP